MATVFDQDLPSGLQKMASGTQFNEPDPFNSCHRPEVSAGKWRTNDFGECNMQLEAIYDHGQLKFAQPVTLKHDYLRLIVNVPNEEIFPSGNPYSLSAEVIERARDMRERLDAIRNAPLPPDAELPELTEKQLERIAAFELREDR